MKKLTAPTSVFRPSFGAAAATILVAGGIFSGVAWAHPETGFLPDAIAETEYKIVLDLNPKDTVTRNKLGIVLYRKNKLKEAEKCFTEVLKGAPGDFDAHDGMGLVRMKERKYEEAAGWFRKAIAIKSQDSLVHYNLAYCLEQTGKLKEAEAEYRRSLQVNADLIRKGINKDLETAKRGSIVNGLTQITNRLKSGK